MQHLSFSSSSHADLCLSVTIHTCSQSQIIACPVQVFREGSPQLTWFYLKLAGYTCMVLVRFDDIMGDSEPSARIDSIHMFVSLIVAVGCAVALARLQNYNAVPAFAVLVAGVVYLALHLIRKWMRQYKKARKDKQ